VETKIFDREGFLERVFSDVDLARAVIQGFLEDMPRQIAALSAAVAQADSNLAGQQAHRIKGAAATAGGVALQQTAHVLELAGTAGNLKTLQELVPGLADQFENLRLALQEFLSSLKTPAQPT
jgi:HPt (histidine-containing phosphotransfer) domain-containing protein